MFSHIAQACRTSSMPACPGVSVCFLHHQQSFFSLLSLVFPHICWLCFHRLWLQARINRDKGPIPCYGKRLCVPAQNVLLTASHLHFNSVNSDFFSLWLNTQIHSHWAWLQGTNWILIRIRNPSMDQQSWSAISSSCSMWEEPKPQLLGWVHTASEVVIKHPSSLFQWHRL